MAQDRGSWRKFFQSCLVIGLIAWALITLTLGIVYLSRYFLTQPPPLSPTVAPSTPATATAVFSVTVEAPSPVPDTPTVTPLPTEAPTATPTVPPPPTPTPSYELTQTEGVMVVALYLDPLLNLQPVGQIQPALLPSLKIRARTVDLQWVQVCCLLGAARPELWINVKDVKLLRPDLLSSVNLVLLPPTPTAAPTPTHFAIEAGPEFYGTSNGILSIFVKVFQGPGGAQTPQAGYTLKVRFKGPSDLDFVERPASNAGAVSQSAYSQFKNGVHIYNLKYEYDPGEPPAGKKKEEMLGMIGQWEFWLSNAQGQELSRRTYMETNPQNPNREVFISYGLVR